MTWIGTFQKLILGEPAPYFLRERNLGTFMEAVGHVYDLYAENLAIGLRLSQPLRCDVSALPYLSFDRSIRLYDTEPIPSQRHRLSQWWQLHKQRGSHQGAMRHVQPYFLGADGKGTLPTIRIAHRSGNGIVTWHTLSGGAYGDETRSRYSVYRAAGDYYNFDDNGRNSATSPSWDPNVREAWSRYWCFIYMHEIVGATWAAPNKYGTGKKYGAGWKYGGGVSSQQKADLVAMFADWKAAHSALWGVALVWKAGAIDPTATPAQDPDGRWNLPDAGQWGRLVDPLTGKATRPVGVQWIYDRSQPTT